MFESFNLYFLELNSLYVKHIGKEHVCSLQTFEPPLNKMTIHQFDSSFAFNVFVNALVTKSNFQKVKALGSPEIQVIGVTF